MNVKNKKLALAICLPLLGLMAGSSVGPLFYLTEQASAAFNISQTFSNGLGGGASLSNNIYSVFNATSGTGSCSLGTKASTATCIVYLSASGSDSNNCVADPPINNSFATPCQTIAHGITLLRDQSPDWLLLKKGDTFLNQTFDQWKLRGANATLVSSSPNTYTGLMLISSWPTTPGARPIVEPLAGTQNVCINTQGGGGSHGNDMDSTAMVGINCYNYKRDPGNGSFTANIDGTIGLQILGAGGPTAQAFVLIEDCVFSFFTVGVNVQGDNNAVGNADHIGKVIFNANTVMFNYRGSSGDIHAEGILQENIQFPIITNNVFNHNGWFNNTGTGQNADEFNHNIYLNNDNLTSSNATVNNNIVLRASANGIQGRAGGQVINNFFAGNAIAGFANDFTQSSMSHNVNTNGENHNWPADNTVAAGLSITGSGTTTGSTLNGNISINPTNTGNNTFGLELDTGTTSDSATGNIACNINPAFSDNGTGNTQSGNTFQTANCTGIGPDPSHATIENFDSTVLGGPGTLDDFATQVSTQSKDFYNANLSAGVVNAFFRQKLGMASFP